MGNWIGQDIEVISKYVDVICPMVYPSHFGPTYLKNIKFSSKYPSREYSIVYFSTKKATSIIHQDTYIRPFLQAFKFRSKNFSKKYITDQMMGAIIGGSKGYSFWNPGSYYGYLVKFLIDK